MKKPLYIALILVFGFNCFAQNNADSNIKNQDLKVYYVGNNGKITDTIYLDSLKLKAIIHNIEIIDNKFYISYSLYNIEDELKYDMSFYYDGHYLNSYDLENLPAPKDTLFDFNKLISQDSAIFLGNSCSHDDKLRFERSNIIPGSDSTIYIYAKLQDCSDWITHIMIKKNGNHFEKLFEIESTDYLVNFRMENDSVLICDYNQLFEDAIDKYTFKFDLKKNKEIE